MTSLLDQVRNWNLSSTSGYRIEVVSVGDYWLVDSNFLRIYKLPANTDNPCYVADKFLQTRNVKPSKKSYKELAIDKQQSARYSFYLNGGYHPTIVENKKDALKNVIYDMSDYAVFTVHMPTFVSNNLDDLISKVPDHDLIEFIRVGSPGYNDGRDVVLYIHLADDTQYTVTFEKIDLAF